MTAKDLLGLIVRVFGLFVMVWGMYAGLYAVIESVGLLPDSRYPVKMHALGFGLKVWIGFVIVHYVDCIVEFAYKPHKPQ